MVGDFIMLPVRLGVRATQLWLRAAEETISVATSVTGRVVGFAASRSSGGNGASATSPAPESGPLREEEPAASAPRRPDAQREDRADTEREDRAAARAASAAPAAEPPAPPAEPGPAHVSEEPALVEEFAEPGAEDGAGAEIHIEEPWDGYAAMNAKQIVSRLAGATPAGLAAVQLYESSHRGRQTILNAVERELRSANGRSDQTQTRG